MGPSESINRALNTFFNGFGIPGYLEDNIPPAASLPYLTYKPTIPGGWNETASFHARLWYPSKGGRAPILQTEDTISAALEDSITLSCEGGAILCKKAPHGHSPSTTRLKGICANTSILKSRNFASKEQYGKKVYQDQRKSIRVHADQCRCRAEQI